MLNRSASVSSETRRIVECRRRSWSLVGSTSSDDSWSQVRRQERARKRWTPSTERVDQTWGGRWREWELREGRKSEREEKGGRHLFFFARAQERERERKRERGKEEAKKENFSLAATLRFFFSLFLSN